MSLSKVTYVDGKTVISAKNLNDIQDAVVALEQSSEHGSGGVTMDEVNAAIDAKIGDAIGGSY